MYELIDPTADLKVKITKLRGCIGVQIFGQAFPEGAVYYQDTSSTYVYDMKNNKRYWFDNDTHAMLITDVEFTEVNNNMLVMPIKEPIRKESRMNGNWLQRVLELADKRRDEIVPLFLGAPGIGKTQAVYQFAEKHNRKVVEIIASQILPSEVSGITMPDEKTGSMRVFDHARLSSLQDGDILFFDELWQADTHVLSACLTLIQERRMMSGKKLPDVLIVAAANPSVTPQMIPASIRQRFITIKVEFDKHEFKEYIKDKYNLKLNGDVLNRIVSDSSSWNFITPRVVEKLIRLAIECKSDDDRRAFLDFASSAYDYDIASSILELVENMDKPGPDEIIRDIAKKFNYDLDGMGIPEMIEYLSNLPEWDEISECMKEVEI